MVTIQSQILDDLDAVFTAGLTIDAVHVNGATNETLKVFFDHNYGRVLGTNEVESEAPSILVKTEDSAHIDRASTFTISGVTYHVAETESDYEGVIRIKLTEDED
jgi:hypothetical protein